MAGKSGNARKSKRPDLLASIRDIVRQELKRQNKPDAMTRSQSFGSLTNYNTPEVIFQACQQFEVLGATASALLTEEEFAVFSRRWNLDGQGCGSRKRVAEELLMTTERARELEDSAMKKLQGYFLDENRRSAFALEPTKRIA
jgi:DNA-directed RNA polymerase sigma subunit (sigma70/sigma32)